MKIYPAMDLINGSCVRLQKGNFDTVQNYKCSPIDTALDFQNQGAEFLHIVDLDGARLKTPQQFPLIKSLVQSTNLKVQVGGGIRTLDDCKRLLDIGVDKVVIGSLAVSDSLLVEEIIGSLGPKNFTLAIDIKRLNDRYLVATNGWQKTTELTIETLLKRFQNDLIKDILCTDISKDGMLVGINKTLYQNLMRQFPHINWLASGGVRDIEDIKASKTMKLAGIIIGKALYENRLSLNEVLKC